MLDMIFEQEADSGPHTIPWKEARPIKGIQEEYLNREDTPRRTLCI